MGECSPQKKEIIIYLAAMGKNYTQIGEATGATYLTIRALLELEQTQFQINQIRYKLYGKDVQKTFKELVPEAQELTATILRDEGQRPEVRLSAAKEIFDRALGKAKQTIEHQNSVIGKLYEMLDKTSEKEILDITPSGLLSPPALETAHEETKEEDLNSKPQETDKIDAWAEENL